MRFHFAGPGGQRNYRDIPRVPTNHPSLPHFSQEPAKIERETEGETYIVCTIPRFRSALNVQTVYLVQGSVSKNSAL
jgi:hypothetical protein